MSVGPTAANAALLREARTVAERFHQQLDELDGIFEQLIETNGRFRREVDRYQTKLLNQGPRVDCIPPAYGVYSGDIFKLAGNWNGKFTQLKATFLAVRPMLMHHLPASELAELQQRFTPPPVPRS